MDLTKFREFDRMIEDAKAGNIDDLIIAWPDVLGDTYEELIENLSLIAEAGLHLVITRRHP